MYINIQNKRMSTYAIVVTDDEYFERVFHRFFFLDDEHSTMLALKITPILKLTSYKRYNILGREIFM